MQRLLLGLGLVVLAFGITLAGWQIVSGGPVARVSEAPSDEAMVSETTAIDERTASSSQAPPAGTPPTVGSRLVPRPPATTPETKSPMPSSTTRPAPPATAPAPQPGTTATTGRGPVVAWQPSHQDDTGGADWHEYLICGDIAQRTMALLAGSHVRSVLAWETEMGLTGSNNAGSNAPAFDSEIRQANEAGAHYFVSIHNDGGAPSGVLGMYFAGDQRSAAVAEQYARVVSQQTGLPYRGIRAAPLYSLDPVRNAAPIRVLLEIGDNVQDREFLEGEAGRQSVARALADVTLALPLP
jgi:N-acetylmuramoyl-L-alanine amidase